MSLEIMKINSSVIEKQAIEAIEKCNDLTYRFGLTLSRAEAVEVLKSEKLEKMYNRGRELIKTRLVAAKKLYLLVRNTRLDTPCYTYNATLSDNGIGSFFKLYDPEYEAHETMASMDYQLCSPVTDLAGVEYIQKYLTYLCLENEFCGCFAAETIHHLLSGYDKGYKDLLVNIFEHVLTGALACVSVKRSITELYVSEEDVMHLQDKLRLLDDQQIAAAITKAAEKLREELHITNPSLQNYISKSLSRLTANIVNTVRTDTLSKTFVTSVNLDLKPKVQFESGNKMEDQAYRELIYEIIGCRYSSDKLALIKEKVSSFGDFEDVLFDANLTREEMLAAFRILDDVDLAVLLKRHPSAEAVRAVDLSEAELNLRECLESYIKGLAQERQLHIKELLDSLDDEE